ncbi:DUF2726 domain-containing protein [Salmonella enterica]|nr:DUF2726 domain-containing protein [Salmonella enterica]EEK2864840.1 DUF2726 domain-containing protein [Salmonella enterica]EEK2973642.1 DUF2726 domain-containing protein [Salmonella enterica]
MFIAIFIIVILLAGFVVLFRQVSQWHCDVVITDRDGRIVAALELGDRTYQAPKRQRRDLLLEDVLKQAGIPLLCGDDEQQLAEPVRAHLCAQCPEGGHESD